jgi:simple sugar transport system ATP-binding protein
MSDVTASSQPPALLRLSGVEKAFVPGRPVLRSLSLEIQPAAIHALLGENGAGKSTLMNICTGLVRPDAGRMEVAGEVVDFRHFGPAEALARGIGMVQQHSTLIPAMTVEENFSFGRPRGLWFRAADETRRLEELCEEFGFEVPTRTRVEQLSVGQRQRAEILRVLDRGARLLILDEPTSVLTPGETELLFPALRRLRDAGHGVIFISHKLDEVEALADRVSVIRRGEVVATESAASLDARTLGQLMLGREISQLMGAAGSAGGALARPVLAQDPAPSIEPTRAHEVAFRLRGVCAEGLREASTLRDIDLDVRRGEILGVVGIDGNGQRELEEVLAGLRPLSAGCVEFEGRAVRMQARALRELGVSHLSGDRERAGLVAGFDLTSNWILKDAYRGSRFFPRGVIDRERARASVERAIDRYRVVPADADADIATLSGGNAQKLAVARELSSAPRLLIAVNPTRGLDVGSAHFVHERLIELRSEGAAVLLISTELEEVLALSDRVVALVRGRVCPVPTPVDRAQLGAIMLGRAESS